MHTSASQYGLWALHWLMTLKNQIFFRKVYRDAPLRANCCCICPSSGIAQTRLQLTPSESCLSPDFCMPVKGC